MGESIVGSLKGAQFYIGPVELEDISDAASSNHLGEHGFTDVESLTKAIEQALEEQFNGEGKKAEISKKEEARFFMGRDSEKQTVILVLSDEGLVFTHGKNVFVLGEGSTVSVSKSGVAITGPDGRNLVVGKGGVVGLDNFLDIGPIVTKSVTEAMKSLRGLKSLKSMKRSMRGWPYSWDSVDDFDWDD
jgi:hypothetical protein